MDARRPQNDAQGFLLFPVKDVTFSGMTINDTISIIDTDDTRMYLFRDEAAKREYRIIMKDDSKTDRFFPGSVYVFFQPAQGNISIGRTRLYDEPPMDSSKMGDPAVITSIFTRAALEWSLPVLERLKSVAGLSDSTPITPCDITVYPEEGPEIDSGKPWFRIQILAGQLEGRGSVPGEETVLVLLSRRGYPALDGPSIEEEASACATLLNSLCETLSNEIS